MKVNNNNKLNAHVGKNVPVIVGDNSAPAKMESGQVIINKKATQKNLSKLIEINKDGAKSATGKITTDATAGGILKGKPHYDENGNPTGGIPAVVNGAKKIEVEGNEFVVNKEASRKHWKELSQINQSEGDGVPINPNDVGADEDPQEYKDGGPIVFEKNKIPSRKIYNFAKAVKEKYPKVWAMGGNIFGNEAFKNLERVIKRGYWKESEQWMYVKWRSFVARHHKDFRIAGTVAMLKWIDETDKGWPYMKGLIQKEIEKKYSKEKMATGGELQDFNWDSVYKWTPEEEAAYAEKAKKTAEQEKEDWYQSTRYSKKWAATYKEAVSKTIADYLSAKATYEDWSNRQYKQNKTGVYLGGDDVFGQSMSIGAINEGRKRNTIMGAKMQMDESIETLSHLGLSKEEISQITSGEYKMLKGGELEKGINHEKEHIDTAKKLYDHKITPEQSAKSIAKDHIKEHANYYTSLENIDFDKHYEEIKPKYALGGSVEPVYELRTPTGEKSRLTYLQQVLVRTSGFKKFFGDWEMAAKMFLADNRNDFRKYFKDVSKVMDWSVLEPRIVYHGTRTEEQFFMFDVSKEKGVGRPYAYFAHNKQYSENFTDFSQRDHRSSTAFLYECFLNIRNPFWALGHAYEMKSRDAEYWIDTITGTIAINKYGTVERNEKTQKLEDAIRSQIEKYIHETAPKDVNFWKFMALDRQSEFKYFLISYGYDGIFYDEQYAGNYDPEDPKQYTHAVTVFTANDIKLANGKNLNFDPMNADIRYENGGVAETPIEAKSPELAVNLSKKERLGNLLFGEKYAKGGTTTKAEREHEAEIYKHEEPNDNRKFVDDLIKKMKE